MATADDGAADITQDRFLSQRTIRAVALGTELPSRDFAAAVGGAAIGAGSPAFRPPPNADPESSDPRYGGSTVQRLVLGGHLRRLREAAGIATERAALTVRGSNSKISRMENGRVGFKERDVADLLTLYGAEPAE